MVVVYYLVTVVVDLWRDPLDRVGNVEVLRRRSDVLFGVELLLQPRDQRLRQCRKRVEQVLVDNQDGSQRIDKPEIHIEMRMNQG